MKVPHTAIAIATGAAIGAAAGYAVDRFVIEPRCDCHSIDDEDTKELDAAADRLDVPSQAAFVPQP